MGMLVGFTGLQMQYLSDLTPINSQVPEPLVSILFDTKSQTSKTLEQGCISTGLKTLTPKVIAETWIGGACLDRGQTKNTLWARTEDYLLLALWAKESEPGGLQCSTELLYNQLFAELKQRAYPHLVRVWNYFAKINHVDNDLERYRQFCIGRFNAFEAQNMIENQYPSACALGHGGGDLLVYVLASRAVPVHIENPRQASAYHYPIQYGPRSPSFARASLLEMADNSAKVFVSGTASVIGHMTVHPDNLQGQIQVTLDNLNYLLAHIAERDVEKNSGNMPSLRPEVLKVYLRYPHHLEEVQQRIQRAYPGVPVVYVAADICRADLLLEMDGIWNLVR
jgi:chorismate lyase / 3-hydroxybenzoate synthase